MTHAHCGLPRYVLARVLATLPSAIFDHNCLHQVATREMQACACPIELESGAQRITTMILGVSTTSNPSERFIFPGHCCVDHLPDRVSQHYHAGSGPQDPLSRYCKPLEPRARTLHHVKKETPDHVVKETVIKTFALAWACHEAQAVGLRWMGLRSGHRPRKLLNEPHLIRLWSGKGVTTGQPQFARVSISLPLRLLLPAMMRRNTPLPRTAATW